MTRAIAVRQGSTISWERITELRAAIFDTKTFGASAPLNELLVKFRFTGDNVYVAAKHQLAHKE